jgi:hypothetical protein
MSNNEPNSTQDHALKHLDKGIERAVLLLNEHGIHTVESCEGGPGHAFPEPTVVFTGGKAEGYRALSVAFNYGLAVMQLRRVWPVIDYEPTGPYWELTFFDETARTREMTQRPKNATRSKRGAVMA